MSSSLPADIDATIAMLDRGDYLADRSLATTLFLALKMGRPLFLEGEAGVGKTEIAKVLAGVLGRRLVRLQCYEGLDVAAAVYEWNYARQMIEIRLAEAAGAKDREKLTQDVFSRKFLKLYFEVFFDLLRCVAGGNMGIHGKWEILYPDPV